MIFKAADNFLKEMLRGRKKYGICVVRLGEQLLIENKNSFISWMQQRWCRGSPSTTLKVCVFRFPTYSTVLPLQGERKKTNKQTRKNMSQQLITQGGRKERKGKTEQFVSCANLLQHNVFQLMLDFGALIQGVMTVAR